MTGLLLATWYSVSRHSCINHFFPLSYSPEVSVPTVLVYLHILLKPPGGLQYKKDGGTQRIF